MSLYNTFGTNKDLERDGITLDYGLNSKDQPIEIRIARAGGANVKFAKILQQKMEPHKRAIANDRFDQKIAEKLLMETYAQGVVLGWSGVEDREGNELAFNFENVMKVFSDLPDLFLDIQQQSQKAALFREDIRKDEQGN